MTPTEQADRHLAPGDDMVERATAALEGVTDGPWAYEYTCIGHTVRQPGAYNAIFTVNHAGNYEPDARFIAFARQWVPEAAARLSALTAQVAKLQDERDKWFEGAGAHHVESMKQAKRADQAKAEVSRLGDRLARLEGAAKARVRSGHDAQCPALIYRQNECTCCHDLLEAALNDGGSNNTPQ